VELDDVIAQSCNDLQIIDGNPFPQVDKHFTLTSPLTHLLKFEERIFFDKKCLEVEKP
jgi:hypothetical protein